MQAADWTAVTRVLHGIIGARKIKIAAKIHLRTRLIPNAGRHRPASDCAGACLNWRWRGKRRATRPQAISFH
jgi:hypothetical protein